MGHEGGGHKCGGVTNKRICGARIYRATQRYCHPQADAIGRAFDNFTAMAHAAPARVYGAAMKSRGRDLASGDGNADGEMVVTDGGQQEIPLLPAAGAKEHAIGV